MEILAGLIRLEEPDYLPAPWYNRPALGLATNTRVNVAVVSAGAGTGAPPDIIVTPLKTDRLHCAMSLTVDFDEKAGTILQVLDQVEPEFNIALTETLTVDQRTRHRITVVLEPSVIRNVNAQAERDHAQTLVNALEARLKNLSGYLDSSQLSILAKDTVFEREDTCVVEYGRIRITALRRWLKKKYFDRLGADYDFDRVVVSSSSENRYIRYVFPRKGTFEATIAHSDTPKALFEISSALKDLDYNILLSRLSRTDFRNTDKSIFVAICEPSGEGAVSQDDKYAIAVADRIADRLQDAAVNTHYQLELVGNRVSLGETTKKGTYPIAPSEPAPRPSVFKRVVEAHGEAKDYIRRHQRFTRPVFVSYRGVLARSTSGGHFLEKIFEAIEAAGGTAFDGFERPEGLHKLSANDARARLWSAVGGIFVAADADWDAKLGDGQLIEWGYTYGQSKPFIVVTKEGQAKQATQFMVPNLSCVTFKNPNSKVELDAMCAQLTKEIKGWFEA